MNKPIIICKENERKGPQAAPNLLVNKSLQIILEKCRNIPFPCLKFKVQPSNGKIPVTCTTASVQF